MEYVGKKVTKEVGGHAPRFGAVESYSPATGLFKVVYNGGDSEEMQLAELSPLLLAPLLQTMGGEIDLNVCGEIDLNEDGDGGLHGLDLNEGVNYVLHEDLNSSLGKRKMIDLNLEADEDETVEGASSSKRVCRLFDLNVESKEDPVEDVVDMGKKILEESRPAMAPPNFFHVDNNAAARIAAETELRRRILMASFAPQNAAGVYSHLKNPPFQTSAAPAPAPVPVLPPKAELPPSSTSLDLKGASLLDFLSVYTFLRSFSVSLFLSPFEIEEFASSLISNGSTSLFDSIHLSLLTTLRGHLKSLSDEGSASASVCLRSLNWDFLDTITWPMFLVEYLLFHSPKHIPGLDVDEFKPLESEYYAMPASAKIAILQHLCDDVVETEAHRSEINKRASMAESHNWKWRYFSCKVKKTVAVAEDGAAKPCRVEEYDNEFVVDGNGDECYVCRADGSLICCDGCPAAFHAKCVGVVSSLLPEGDWFCPECTIDKAKPYTLSRNVRGVELRGSDPHARLYYSCCHYLLVSDSCDDEHSFSLYNANDISAVVAALESSSPLYHTTASAIREHWSLTPNQLSSAESRGLPVERKSDGSPLASNIPRNIAVPPHWHCNVASVPAETAQKGKASSEGSTEVSQTKGSDNSQIQGAPPQESDYANSYEFGRMASPLSGELASELSDEDARRSAEQMMGVQMRVISNRYAAFFAWSNMNSQSKKEKCGWCFSCKFPEIAQTDCLFITNDTVRAADQKFASKALGIRAGAKMGKHLSNVVCHVVWMEDRLLGLLSGPWTNPNYSKNWRAFAQEAAHIGYLKYLLLKLESNLHLRALSADWTKSVDSAVTMGSAFHVVRKSARVVSRIGERSSRSKRKCSKKEINKTPEDAAGVSLSWWRGGRASRELFQWKVLPRSLASKAARRGGCEKIVGVYYPDSGEYAKRMKFIAWRAAVRAAKTVEQLALQVRVLDANIKWNEIGNINLLPEQESSKPAKSFKNVVIRKKRREGEVVKYLLDFGKSRLIPNIVVKHGSLLQDSLSSRKRYWLEESHVPLHLLKAFQEKRLLRASNNDTSEELHDQRSNEMVEEPERKKGFEYLFERAERLERTICEHCNESVLIREAVGCQFCKGFFHKSHAKEIASPSSAEAMYACYKCWEKEFVQKHKKESKALKQYSKTGKKVRKRKQAVQHSEERESPPSDVPMQHSVGDHKNAESSSLQTAKGKKRRRGKRADPDKEWWDSVINDFTRGKRVDPRKELDWNEINRKTRKKRRGERSSSYWLKGVRLSRRTNDAKVDQFRSRMLLVLSGEDAPTDQNPKCSLCGESQRASNLSYIACENCGAWFHGDALGLSADRIRSIIGLKCHDCLNKRPPVCPHRCRTGNHEDAKNNAETSLVAEDRRLEDEDYQLSDNYEETF